ncbi:MAG: trypsin-like serine protease [Rhodospirillaceae bacterium]|nr:trypsin-like serine protease [Rhodospirillaceae bacterium]
MPWTAAVGQLQVGQGGRPCTAVLVAPDLIVTAAHCLFQGETSGMAAGFAFHPNFGAQPDLGSSRAFAIRAIGSTAGNGAVDSAMDVAADWALVGIEPPVRAVAPVAVARLTTQEILARLRSGASLYTAGYGYGATRELRRHGRCQVVDPPDSSPVFTQAILVTDCIIRIGDSGGPIVLIDESGRPNLIGIFSGFGTNGQTGLAFGSNAANFAPYLAPPLLSWLGLGSYLGLTSKVHL